MLRSTFWILAALLSLAAGGGGRGAENPPAERQAGPTPPSSTTSVRGTVFADRNGNGRQDDDEAGLQDVAVSDGLTTATTDAQGHYRLDIDRGNTSGLVFVVTPAGHKAGAGGYFRRPSLTTPEAAADFGLLPAPERNQPDWSFVHISDTHVGGAAMTDTALGDALADIAALHPAFIVATGDLTDSGRVEQFAAYRRSIESTATPVFPCVGNHDGACEKHLGPSYYAFEAGRCHFIVLNSSLVAEPAARQMTWLKRELDRLPKDKAVFVFQHIPPRDVRLPGLGQSLPELLAGCNVQGLFTGHWHSFKVFRHADKVRHVSTPPLCFSDMVAGPRGFMRVVVKGNDVSLDARYAGCKQVLAVVHPADGATVMPGPLALTVNAYDVGSLAPRVKCQLDDGPWTPMTALGKWNWQGRAEVQPGPHRLKAQATWDNGAVTEMTAAFSASAGNAVSARPGRDWPMFKGGPDRSGATADAVIPPLRLAWSRALGGAIFMSSPVVAGEIVYIGVADEDLTGQAGVCALDARTGARKWFHPTGASVKHTVAVAGGRVVAVSVTGEVVALDAATGTLQWTYGPESPVNQWTYAAPLVADGVVYAVLAPSYFVALDAATGKRLWQVKRSGANCPASPADGGDRVVMGLNRSDGLHVLTKPDGREVWNCRPLFFNFATPAVSKTPGRVYHAACAWQGASALYAIDLDAGNVAWSFDMLNRWPTYLPSSSPALAGSRVYLGSPDGKLWCIDAQSGSPVWSLPLGRPTSGSSAYFLDENPVISSPAVSGGVVYVGDLNGRLYGVAADNGKVRWAYDLGAPILSSPAVSGNAVFIAALDGSVYALAACP